jgi:ElaB/YqjD/DUF883 family membrane-anchored ribosome-binding protein
MVSEKSEILESKSHINRLYFEKGQAINEQISILNTMLELKGRLYDAKDLIDNLERVLESVTEKDIDNFDAIAEKVDPLVKSLVDKLGDEETRDIFKTLDNKVKLELELVKMPEAVSQDTSYCPVEWGEAYKKTQEYGKSIGIDVPSGYVFIPVEDAENGGFVLSVDDPEVYLRPDASSKTVSHELFHKVHKNEPDMSKSKTERKICKEGLADWFSFKVHGENVNPRIEDFFDYINHDIYRNEFMDEIQASAPYRLGLMLFNDIEKQYGTEIVVEIAKNYKGPGLKPLLDLVSSDTRKMFDRAFSVVYDKPISDIPQPVSS